MAEREGATERDEPSAQDEGLTTMAPTPLHRRFVKLSLVRRLVSSVVIGLLLALLSVVPAIDIVDFHSRQATFSDPYVIIPAWRQGAWIQLTARDRERGSEPVTFGSRPAAWWSRVNQHRHAESINAIEIAWGIPLPVLSGGELRSYDQDQSKTGELEWGVRHIARRMTIQIERSDGNIRPIKLPDSFFPTRILWRGLIGNTIFYGVIVWCVLTLVGWCRRAIRRRRGRCEWCAYSLRGLENAERCPECGRGTRRNAITAGVASSRER